jgi:integrase
LIASRRKRASSTDHYAKTIRAAVRNANLQAARRRAAGEVDVVSVPEGTSSHDLRHHYASLLIAAGEDVITVADRLGHKDAALVLRVYGHLMKNGEDRTRQAVDDAWARPEAVVRRGSRAPSVPREERTGR